MAELLLFHGHATDEQVNNDLFVCLIITKANRQRGKLLPSVKACILNMADETAILIES